MRASDRSSDMTRRVFLTAALAAGGGLLIGASLSAGAKSAVAVPAGPYIRIDPANRITLILPYVEMGQGAYTSQVQLLAEELEVDPTSVTIEPAPPDEALYSNPLYGSQVTGGSGSLQGAWMSLRAAGAAARMMLIEAGAKRLNVPVADCRAANGEIIHNPTGRKLAYGAVAQAAAQVPVPQNPVLKPASAYKLIGKPLRRLDTLEKITGAAKFGIDVRPPGVRYATVAATPIFNGTLHSVDATDAMKVAGVQQVVQLSNAVAVIGATTWAARKGLAALKVTWNDGANAHLSTADLAAQADAALNQQGLMATQTGDVRSAEAQAAHVYEAEFRLPLLAHAALEPLSCTVDVSSDACEIWVGSQILGQAQKAAAEAAGLALEKVIVHNKLLGGGFGRRLETDYVTQAVQIAKQVRGPVKVTWSREEDMRHDYYRYINHSRVAVGVNGAGRPVSWRHKVVGPSIEARLLPIDDEDRIDFDIVDGASAPYDIPNVEIEFVRHEAPPGLATGYWRGVGPTRNVVIVESVIDDLAHRAGIDPVVYRRSLITGEPRLLAVLDLVAEKADWGKPLGKGVGRGVAVFKAFSSYLAMVAQVRVEASGEIKVQRVVCAVDAGIVVNPDIVRAQIEGGVIFGLSAVLWGKITIANGRVEQGNFDTYRVMRMREAPAIDVHLVNSGDEPGGVGEPGTSGAIAAVANAVFAVTGKRAFSLPLDPAQFRQT